MPKDLIPMSPRTPWRLFLSTVKYRIIIASYNKIKIALTTKIAHSTILGMPSYNFHKILKINRKSIDNLLGR